MFVHSGEIKIISAEIISELAQCECRAAFLAHCRLVSAARWKHYALYSLRKAPTIFHVFRIRWIHRQEYWLL